MNLSAETANQAADAVCDLLNGGYLRIYGGTPPADADAPLSGNTLIAELNFGSPAFQAAVNGEAESNPLTPENAALATGTATFFRAVKSDGSTVVYQGTAGSNTEELILSSANIIIGSIVDVLSITYTHNRD